MLQRLKFDAKVIPDLNEAPSDDVKCLAGGSKPVGMFVGGICFGCSRRQPIALRNARSSLLTSEWNCSPR
jgi:hypothetical protein